MTTISNTSSSSAEISTTRGAATIPSWALLALGALLSILTGPRWSIPLLAWVAPVPYLLFARRAVSRQAWLALFGVILAAACLQTATIVTSPLPAVAAFGFGAPLALVWLVPIAAAEWFRRRIGDVPAIFAFASLTAVSNWLGYEASELGAWVTVANSQVESLPLLQLASLVGLGGIGFLMGWTAAAIGLLAAAPRVRGTLLHALVAVVTACAAALWGSVRLDTASTTPAPTVIVGSVVTDIGPSEQGLPSAETLAHSTELLFERTRLAAARGARLVVWNEAATFIQPSAEADLVGRGQTVAQKLGIDLVLAYAVVLPSQRLLFDNKHVFITSEGDVADTYRKHHPVPGEPSLRGEGPLVVLDRPYGRVGAALCYDYDFPAMAREHAQAGADLVVVPSSDWRGIDPVHTLMTRVRAIEGGFSVVRASRWSSSAVFDAFGRVRAWSSGTEANDGVMVASVPVSRFGTLYSVTGDASVGLAAAYLFGAVIVAALRKRRRARAFAAPASQAVALLTLLVTGCSIDLSDLVPATVDRDPDLPALDLNDTRLHLQTYGSLGDPVVIVLHGGPGGDYRSLEPLSVLADHGFFVVLWDQRGTGLSRRHDCDDLTADRYLADLEALVDRFAPPDGPPLFFVGHSWGAMYATWYMNEHPERASAAVLVEPGGLTKSEVDEYFSALVTTDPFAEELGDALWTGRMITPDDHARADLMNAVMYDAVSKQLGMSGRAPFWRGGGFVATCLPPSAGNFDWTTRLGEVSAPILYLHGDRNRVSPPGRQRRIARHYHDVTVREIEGAGHDLHWSKRDTFVGMTREHFQSVLAEGGAQ